MEDRGNPQQLTIQDYPDDPILDSRNPICGTQNNSTIDPINNGDCEVPPTDEIINTTHSSRLPGTFPPEWLPDHQASSCMSCDAIFSLIKRRHHCRCCGKIYCSDCCSHRAKLSYLGKKDARVCTNCLQLLEMCNRPNEVVDSRITREPIPSSSASNSNESSINNQRLHGVLKDSESNIPVPHDQVFKQVMFSDGILPGTDLYETLPASPSTHHGVPILARQRKNINSDQTPRKVGKSVKNNYPEYIIVCDELGYLPPIDVCRCPSLFKEIERYSNQGSDGSSIQLDGIMRFDQILPCLQQTDGIMFLLLRDLHLRVKTINIETNANISTDSTNTGLNDSSPISNQTDSVPVEYWCFCSNGLSRLGQREIVLVLDKPKDEISIPRDVFKIYLTIHELALRKQVLENLGNLLFQDGIFGNRDTAGLLLVKPMDCHKLSQFALPEHSYLFALILQRWEIPWSKVFPIRLLLRLGHKFGHYPYPLVSYRSRAPVYYEVGHTIISILADFRNFRYSMTHVDGLKVILIKSEKRVIVQLDHSCYQQFNKVLDSASNEHVLAWSAYPFSGSDGHLVSVQNDEGLYETVEFHRKKDDSETGLNDDDIIGANFVIFSGALKSNHGGKSAKISIVEDGLLIQLQSSTLNTLKRAIHSMDEFNIDCDDGNKVFNNVKICWQENDV